MKKSKIRGYGIEYRDNQWFFSDNGEPTKGTWENRPCGHCGKANTAEGHDGCLGALSGLMNACCGHGNTRDAYVQYPDGKTVHGKKAVKIQNGLKSKK